MGGTKSENRGTCELLSPLPKSGPDGPSGADVSNDGGEFLNEGPEWSKDGGGMENSGTGLSVKLEDDDAVRKA